MAIIIDEIRTFSIDSDNWLSTGNIKSFFTLSELLQIEESVKRTIKSYEKLNALDSQIESLNEELLNKHINGTPL